MQFLGHITDEASRAIGIAVTLLLVAAITVVAFVVWAIVMIVRAYRKPTDSRQGSQPKSERD